MGRSRIPTNTRSRSNQELPQQQSGRDQARALQDESTIDGIQLHEDCHSPCQQDDESWEALSNSTPSSTRTHQEFENEIGSQGLSLDDENYPESVTSMERPINKGCATGMVNKHTSSGKLQT